MQKSSNLPTDFVPSAAIVSYPDPVLRKMCQPIDTFSPAMEDLVEKMLELMHERKGVGLAGPQVGLSWRIFVWNATGEPADNRVSINPVLSDLHDAVEADEGCLSIENVNVKVRRAATATLTAQRIDGTPYTLTGEGLVARIWQHETDHLDGRLILDYMSPAETIANRRAIRELEARFKQRGKHRRQ